MPTFNYRAKKGPNEVVSGDIEAATLEEALEKLEQEGLLPVHVDEVNPSGAKPQAEEKKERPAPGAGSAPPKKSIFGRIKFSEITIFGRQLASLIKAGVPILRSLWIIREQSENTRFRDLLDHVHEEVKNGKPLSSVLVLYPKFFPPVYIAMVRAGEDSGTLQESLLRVSDYRQKQEEIFSHLRTAMAYPALMALTGVGTIVFMLTFVIPRLTTLFKSMGGHLPLPTRILMDVSSLFQRPWFWVGAAIVVLSAVIAAKARPAQIRFIWSRLSLQLPVVKGFVMKAELARFSRTLELLIKSGIPILRAIEITTPVLKNQVLREQFTKAQKDLTGGGSLGKSLRECEMFPLFMTNLISVAEESGKLDEAMQEIAQFYERETDEAIKVMTALLEPLMILVMGAVVGFIVIAMLLPMFELNMMVH